MGTMGSSDCFFLGKRNDNGRRDFRGPLALLGAAGSLSLTVGVSSGTGCRSVCRFLKGPSRRVLVAENEGICSVLRRGKVAMAGGTISSIAGACTRVKGLAQAVRLLERARPADCGRFWPSAPHGGVPSRRCSCSLRLFFSCSIFLS